MLLRMYFVVGVVLYCFDTVESVEVLLFYHHWLDLKLDLFIDYVNSIEKKRIIN